MELKISGLDQLEKTFKKLPKSTQNKALKPALREGAKIVRKAASDNINAIVSDKATGVGARSLSIYTLKVYKGMLRVAVMVRKGAINKVNGARVGLYLSVLEYGKQGQRPRSWIRKAAREKSTEAINKVAQEVSARMEQAVEDAKR